ncbi:ATP-binding protein [Intrasporangium sp. YIM S08009]|uniref:ATP-binding protein n=1 Tax=Intrasporangium zincisolvens TaxID=3080018 RepID=UPI002B058D81|nr:ATP-binding protein [Intrasporangium sp. YIM S08009]
MTHDTTFGADVRSDDGRTFVAATERLSPGDLAVIESDHETLLAQVRDRFGDPAVAAGVVLGHLKDGRLVRPQGRDLLDQATIRPANREEAEHLQAATRASMEVGTWQLGAAEAPLRLRPAGFARHTFVCGQSGSGKTYALGVVLEQLILQTRLRLFVIDPNADFVHLGTTRDDAPAGTGERLAAAGTLDVQRADATGAEALRVRFGHLSLAAQASVMQLNPVTDRGEFNEWLHVDVNDPSIDLGDLMARMAVGSASERAFAQRVENLGIGDWQVWPINTPGAVPMDERSARTTVLDVSGFGRHEEQLVVALDLLDRLWAEREERQPALVVIDESHNICPSDPSTPLQRAVTDRLIQIAAEGRKYGLWLLLSTQRPSKVHPQVVSQCDNLMLMRMNSPSDVADLSRLFGFAPEAMLDASPNFYQGEALFAGAFVPVPSFGRMGARLTIEGGIDVPVPLP